MITIQPRDTPPPGFARVMHLRNAAAVQRSHTCRMLVQHTLASHSYGVLMLIFELYRLRGTVFPSGGVLMAAAVHDLSEYSTGDVPATAKWDDPDLRAALNRASSNWEYKQGLRIPLSEDDQKTLKFCDMMEFVCTCYEEVTMGNRFALQYLVNAMMALSELPLPVIDGSNGPGKELLLTMLAQVNALIDTIQPTTTPTKEDGNVRPE